MAEIGVVKVAGVALRGGPAALPAPRSHFSQRQGTQPWRRAILGSMRDEDWTFRDAEVRLAEHYELGAGLGRQRGPNDTTRCRFLCQLAEPLLEQTVRAVVGWLMPQTGLPATVAVEATGRTPGAISTCFVKRAQDREPGFTWRPWRNWTMAVEVDRRSILAQTTRRGPTNECATLRPLVDTAHQHGPMRSSTARATISMSTRLCRPTVSCRPREAAPRWHIRGIRAHRRQQVPTPR